jgi:hypothetical protein
MNSFPFFNRRQFIPLLLFSTLGLASGFGVSYQQDESRINEMGQLALSYLSYPEDLKDDMAMIDWSKNMEKLNGLRYFQVKVNSKVTEEGGNQEFLTPPIAEGIEYDLPSNWSYHVTSNADPQNTKEFLLIYNLSPGPLFWGLSSFFSALLAGLMMIALQPRNLKINPSKILAVPSGNDFTNPLTEPTPRAHSSPILQIESPSNEKPFLLVDKALIILQVSTQAAILLDRNLNQLNKGHLIDLKPDPLLIQAVENAEEAKFSNPFADHPHISAFVKRDTKGCLIFLETENESPNPQKR